MVTVEVPVRRKGKPPLEIIIGMEPGIFLSLFEQWNLPEGWLAGLIDRERQLHRALAQPRQNVGKPARTISAPPRARGDQGWNEMLSLEGGTVANAHVTSPLSGWVMGLAADKSLFEAPIRNTILVAGARRRRDARC